MSLESPISKPAEPRPAPITPVAGYRQLSRDELAHINDLKQIEELVLTKLDQVASVEGFDGRWLAIARTQIEQGFMAADRSIVRPARLSDLQMRGTTDLVDALLGAYK